MTRGFLDNLPDLGLGSNSRAKPKSSGSIERRKAQQEKTGESIERKEQQQKSSGSIERQKEQQEKTPPHPQAADESEPVKYIRPKCPACGSTNVPVYNSNHLPIRYHKCGDCGHRFKSVEVT